MKKVACLVSIGLIFFTTSKANASWKSQYKKGRELLKEKNFSESRKFFVRSYTLAPSSKHSMIANKVARTFYGEEQYALAVVSFDTLRLSDMDFIIYVRSLYRSGDIERLKQLYPRIYQLPNKYTSDKSYLLSLVPYDEGRYKEALKHLRKVRSGSVYYLDALYNIATSYAHLGQVSYAGKAFSKLKIVAKESGREDYVLSAQLGLARVYYQGKKFKKALDVYRDIPKSSLYWRRSISELSWTYILLGKYRSAMGLLHAMHSPHFQNFYNPDSFLIRAMLYEKICLYGQASKVIALFLEKYGGIHKDMEKYAKSPKDFFKESVKSNYNMRALSDYVSARGGVEEVHLWRNIHSGTKFLSESSWVNSSLGVKLSMDLKKYRSAVLKKGVSKISRLMKIGSQELDTYFREAQHISYELLFRNKDQLKARLISGKKESESIEKSVKRGYYIQNGYEYWPFQGEYWLDELGAYSYVGKKKNCN